jgi:predicted anti-sigma-YlaC factor YlaD
MSLFGLDHCERARLLAALAPDGELSELDRRRLGTHLRSCPPCARFASDVAHLTTRLREDELVRPSLTPLVPHVARSRRELAHRVRPVVAAAAVALMALGVASRAPLNMDGGDSVRTTTPAPGSAQREQDSLRAWRHETLLRINLQPLERSVSIGRNQPV